MATQPLSPLGLKLQLEQKPNEIIVHCEGKITAENSAAFQREIRDLIPESQGQIAAKSYRIVLDLRPPQQNLWVDSGSGRRPNV